jgi:hypothetical protein
MPRDDRISTLWRFLGPVASASSLDAGMSDFDSDLYTEAIFVECDVRIIAMRMGKKFGQGKSRWMRYLI